MCAFPTNSIRCIRNPLRRSAFIHLNVDCLLKDGQKHLFEGKCMGRTKFKAKFNGILLNSDTLFHRYSPVIANIPDFKSAPGCPLGVKAVFRTLPNIYERVFCKNS